MKYLTVCLFFVLGACAVTEPSIVDANLSTTPNGGACSYWPAENVSLSYISDEKHGADTESEQDEQYWITFQIISSTPGSELLDQLVTAACKDEFKNKRDVSGLVTQRRSGGCVPMKINPLGLSDSCAKQFIGNDY